MNEAHTIRLGPAWTLFRLEVDAQPRSLNLPGRWDRSDDPVRLERWFGQPVRGVEGMAVALRLANVPGLRAVRLNGSLLGLGVGTRGDLPIPNDRLAARNRLELDVDRRGLGEADDGPWGEVALVFGSATDRNP